MKGIRFCAECASYSMKEHRCLAGAVDEGRAQDPFYVDCPLPDVVEVVRCKDCKYRCCGDCMKPENVGTYWDEEAYDTPCYIYVEEDHFCSYGERKENEK